jgi:hypothetical protein
LEKLVERSVAERSPPSFVIVSKRFTASRAAPLTGESASEAATMTARLPATSRKLRPWEAATCDSAAMTSAHCAART